MNRARGAVCAAEAESFALIVIRNINVRAYLVGRSEKKRLQVYTYTYGSGSAVYMCVCVYVDIYLLHAYMLGVFSIIYYWLV